MHLSITVTVVAKSGNTDWMYVCSYQIIIVSFYRKRVENGDVLSMTVPNVIARPIAELFPPNAL